MIRERGGEEKEKERERETEIVEKSGNFREV